MITEYHAEGATPPPAEQSSALPADIQALLNLFDEGGTKATTMEQLLQTEPKHHQAITIQIIRDGRHSIVNRCLHKFRGLDHNIIALEMIRAGRGEILAIVFLPTYHELNAEVVQAMAGGKIEPWDILTNLRSFSDQGLTAIANMPEITKQINTEIIMGALKQFDFWRLKQLLSMAGGQKDIPTQTKMQDTLLELMRDKQYNMARVLGECLKLCGINPKTIVAEWEEATRDESNKDATSGQKERQLRDNHVDVGKEIIRFYVNRSIQAGLDTAVAPDEELASTKYEVDKNDIRMKINEETTKLFRWMRQYLIRAVHSESSHKSPMPDLLINEQRRRADNIDDFIKQAGEEDIRSYLYIVSRWFNNQETPWETGYGGPVWNRIAILVNEMWIEGADRDPAAMSIIIDRAFQIEHHGGMVFDKDRKRGRIYFNREREKAVLDANFQATTPTDLLATKAVQLWFDQSFIAVMKDRLRAYRDFERRIARAPRRPKLGGD